MNILDIFLATVEYAITIPLGFMCILPIINHNKIKNKILLPVMSAVMLILSFICGILKVAFHIKTNLLLLPLMGIVLILYFAFYNYNKSKMWYIYTSVAGIFTFSGLASYFTEAILNPSGSTGEVQTYGLLARWILITVFIIIYNLIIKKVRCLMEDYHLNSIWKFIWLVPTFIVATNIMMIPQDYSLVSAGRLIQIYIVADTLLLLLYVLFQIMLYIIAKAITDKASAEQKSQMLSIQANQYENLKKYIENTSRLRHDFRHMARTASQLAKNCDNKALIKLLEEYNIATDSSHSQKIFCEHSALNAVICYYYDEAIKNNIKCDWQISITNDIAISDIELCSVVGNLLDNAIQACKTVDETRRSIVFKADIEKNKDIYIVLTNSFNGIIKRENGKYSSTKANGSGIGLESIKTTVNNHNGYVKFYNDKQYFYTDIMIQQKV